MTTHDGQHTTTDEDQWSDLNKLKKRLKQYAVPGHFIKYNI